MNWRIFVLLAIFVPTVFAKSNTQTNLSDDPPVAVPVVKRRAPPDAAVKVMSAPGTMSFQTKWLETDSEARKLWLGRIRREARERLMSPQFSKIREFGAKPYSAKKEKSVITIGDHKIKSMDPGLGKPNYVADIDAAGTENVFLNCDQFLPSTAVISSMTLSPKKNYLAIVITVNGSIDNQRLLIFDTATHQQLASKEIFSSSTMVSWWDATSVFYDHPASDSTGWAVVKFDVISQRETVYPNFSRVEQDDWRGLVDNGTGDLSLHHLTTEATLTYSGLTDPSFFAEDKDFFYLDGISEKNSNGAVYRLAKTPGAVAEVLLPATDSYLQSASLENESLFLTYTKNGREIFKVFDLAQKSVIAETLIPDCCSLSMATWKDSTQPHGPIEFFLRSTLKKSEKFAWTPGAELDAASINNQMNSSADLEVVTRIEMFKSSDGTMIPARLTYQKGLNLDGQRPVYMLTYGGFLVSGYMAPLNKPIYNEFIKRGGVLVGTGVRGGSENGYDWYSQASGLNKIKTSQDIIAIAQGLVTLGITQPSKIISSGTSNGGYTVASAARLSPSSFGLVIPISGVHDQLNFHLMDRFGYGWERDYSDPNRSQSFRPILQRSSLELPSSLNTPEFLIIAGEEDGRVNKSHSYKLKSVLDLQAPGRATLLVVDQAGHWPDYIPLIGEVGLETFALEWARIFDFSGMTF